MSRKVVSNVMLTLLIVSTLTLAFKIQPVKASGTVYISVPFHFQRNDYYCGPAALEMVFDYYGEDILQIEIADVARTDPSGTYTDELRRAVHFSNLSISLGDEMPGSITGYSARKVGYAAFEQWGLSTHNLKALIDEEKPLIVLMWWSSLKRYGHYRIVVGYNATHIIMHDPWNKNLWGGTYGGANTTMTYSTFLDLWEYSGNWGLLVLPLDVKLQMPNTIVTNCVFEVNATITYPCPSSFDIADYPASSCNATIQLSEGLELASGETARHNLGTILAGDSVQTSWLINATEKGIHNILVRATGIVEGSVGPPSYEYEDEIGGSCFNLLSVAYLHDIAIERVTTSNTVIVQGLSLHINVTVFNCGMSSETFSVSAYANTTVVKTENVMLINGTSSTVMFTWNTTLYVLGNYTISAYAWPVDGETDIGDNRYVDGIVRIVPQIHDLAITDISTHKTVLGQEYSLHFNVTVENLGNTAETFDITAYANTIEIGTLVNITLTSGDFTTIAFIWDTTGWAKGNYTLSANVTIISGEMNTTDNTLVDGIVTVTIPGDVNGNGHVFLYDAVMVGAIYGAKKGDPNYDSNCDINDNGQIFLYDAVIIGANYGQKDP